MGDGAISPKIGNMKALLGIVAGAGASYGLYKLLSGGGFKRYKKSVNWEGAALKGGPPGEGSPRPGSLLAKVSGLDVVCPQGERTDAASGDTTHQTPGNLQPEHLKMLLTCLQTSTSPSDRCRLLLTLGNAAAFTVNQNIIREFKGIPVIGGLLSDPAPEVKTHALNALSNLCMNTENQEQLKVYVPQVLESIEMSPVNSDLQLGALRLLTNLSVTDKHQYLLKDSVTLLLSLLVVCNEELQAPASVMLLFDVQTASSVLLRLLTFAGNLKAWRPSAQVADQLRRKQDCLFRVMLDESSQLQGRLVELLSHPDKELQAQVARVLT
ncbi:armadillo repeat-containing protein 10 isoform X2 [Nerophis ophidion]|uniref:armadillo repeat-containing protein 10 isoform X2 n=1 Tax=Nerophis ophidion TaxID=159077 RepID=UPI002AE0A00A|nr:armadillo repeat-containing protein 10 isoform X2 [Nerophis ophidion]